VLKRHRAVVPEFDQRRTFGPGLTKPAPL
jgi:hypothetical protein